jgi:general secretion pathway protein E
MANKTSSPIDISYILVELCALPSDEEREIRISCEEDTTTSFEEELLRRGIASHNDISHAYALYFDMEIFSDLSSFPFDKDLCSMVPYSFVKKNLLLPLEWRDDHVVVAVANPLHVTSLDELRFLIRAPIHTVYASQDMLLKAINLCYHNEKGAASRLIAGIAPSASSSGEKKDYDILDDDEAPIIKLLNILIAEAIQQKASDIHFDPSPEGLKIRYRIDSVLHPRLSPPQEYQSKLITRIKVMAQLDIAERRLPQDGRIKVHMGGKEIDFRVSTMPVADGERIVLRILDKDNVIIDMHSLGMNNTTRALLSKLITLPEGIILVTGPTGSGKTTTLYSALKKIYSESINIITIEDPVEYNLPGIAQINVQPKIGLSFAKGLRHILRQDPDIIMVGEARDKETAEIAIQAALTGHLVLTTLHTNDAPSAMTRLIDMGIEPYLLSSSIKGVLAQRLVRTICPHCKEAYSPSDEELASLSLAREDIATGTLYKGKGCSLCFKTGYKGRQGIYELMTMSSTIKRQISHNADASAIRSIALQEGMESLYNNGSDLVLQGVTTIEEVLRVTAGADEEGI